MSIVRMKREKNYCDHYFFYYINNANIGRRFFMLSYFIYTFTILFYNFCSSLLSCYFLISINISINQINYKYKSRPFAGTVAKAGIKRHNTYASVKALEINLRHTQPDTTYLYSPS